MLDLQQITLSIMSNILVIGAGLSASSMIRYFLQNAEKEKWEIRIIDRNEENAKRKAGNHSFSEGFALDALNEEARKPFIEWADIVISMLPARFHIEIAKRLY